MANPSYAALYAPLAVPPPPPRPPVLNLITSSLRPLTTTDTLGPGQMSLPDQAPGDDADTGSADPTMDGYLGAQRTIFQATKLTRWTGGFSYAPENQITGVTRDPCLNTTDDEGVENLPFVNFVPFLIVVEDTLSTFGWSERDFKGRALRLLDNATPNAVETEFWNGTQAQASGWPNNYLVNHGDGVWVDLTPGGGPPSVTRGLAILEDYLANASPSGNGAGFGAQGMIHLMPQTSPNLLGARRVGNLLLSVMDNIIVPGSGYPGVDNGVGGGSTSTTSVMYATDIPIVLLDDPNVYPDTLTGAVERDTNTIRFRAQRYAACAWDGFRHAAVRVVLGT
jgi:hypothetical protein